jgi:hypothetical protein
MMPRLDFEMRKNDEGYSLDATAKKLPYSGKGKFRTGKDSTTGIGERDVAMSDIPDVEMLSKREHTEYR